MNEKHMEKYSVPEKDTTLKIVNVSQIVNELLEVLVKNEVPVKALDNVLDELKNIAYINTIIQSKNLNEIKVYKY